MSLSELPDDILFSIVGFLQPPDIISLRKTCKRLQTFTSERAVWTNPEYFLPLTASTVPELERAALCGNRLKAIWDKNQLIEFYKRPPPVLKSSWSFKIAIADIRCLELFRGRYLIVGGVSSILLYDLQTKCEIFRYDSGSTKLHWLFSLNGLVNNSPDVAFIPFVKGPSTLAFCEIHASGKTSIADITGFQASKSAVRVSNDFCIVEKCNSPGVPFLVHFPSQKIYPFSTTDEGKKVSYEVVFLPGHVLLVYSISSTQPPKFRTYLELFPLPDPTVVPAGSILQRIHSGGLLMGFTEPTFISSDISGDHTGSINLIVLSHSEGARPLRITLQPDEKMAFYIPMTFRRHPLQSVPPSPFYSLFTVASGSRARGMSYMGNTRPAMALYDVYPDPLDYPGHVCGDLLVDIVCIDVDIPGFEIGNLYTFDAFQGLLCTAFSQGVIHLSNLTDLVKD